MLDGDGTAWSSSFPTKTSPWLCLTLPEVTYPLSGDTLSVYELEYNIYSNPFHARCLGFKAAVTAEMVSKKKKKKVTNVLSIKTMTLLCLL